MKKLINDPDDVLADALRGVAAAHPELRVDHQHRGHLPGRAQGRRQGRADLGRRLRTRAAARRVRRPGHARRRVRGEVFTSPTPDQMVEATTVVDRGAGVLHIVKNYTGDVMNFEMAGELAAADSGVASRRS